MNRLKECLTDSELLDYIPLLGHGGQEDINLFGLQQEDIKPKPLNQQEKVIH